MNEKSIDIDEALERVKFYHEKGMHFSEMQLWEKILEKAPTEYRKLSYAGALRLCGFFLRSEQAFSDVNYEAIPGEYKYWYHIHLAHLYMDMGNAKQCREQLLICMDFEECDTIPYVYMASILKRDKDNAEAIYYLKLALDKDGDIDEVYYNLSTRLAIKGDMEGALDAINKCLTLSPDYPNANIFKNDLENYFASKETTIE